MFDVHTHRYLPEGLDLSLGVIDSIWDATIGLDKFFLPIILFLYSPNHRFKRSRIILLFYFNTSGGGMC